MQQSREFCLQAIAIHRETEDRRSEAFVRGNFAQIQVREGDFAAAIRSCEEAVGILRALGDRRSEGIVLGNLGSLLRQVDRAEMAERALKSALEIHGAVGNRDFEGVHACELSLCLLSLGRLDDAATAWRRGSGILKEAGEDDAARARRAEVAEGCRKAGVPPFEEVAVPA